jgi:hypothetical protein
MKKQTLVAVIGTLALAANILLPSLAFGQATETQTGTADILCDTTAPSFSSTPAATFSFYGDGSSTSIYASNIDQQAFNNPNGAPLDSGDNTDSSYLNDGRNPEVLDCNNGLTFTVTVQDGTDADGIYFDANPTGAGGDFIELEDLMVVSSSDNCLVGHTEAAQGICFDDLALCGQGDGVTPVACTTEGSTSVDYTGTSFATWATYTGNGATLGTTNTPSSTTLMSFADGSELFGRAGLATSYGVYIDGGDKVGTYVVEILYTLTGL